LHGEKKILIYFANNIIIALMSDECKIDVDPGVIYVDAKLQGLLTCSKPTSSNNVAQFRMKINFKHQHSVQARPTCCILQNAMSDDVGHALKMKTEKRAW
jgi:hypothetical protein